MPDVVQPQKIIVASELLTNTLPEKADPCKIEIAFGRRAIPKLIEELNSKSILTRQKALVALAGIFHKPDNLAQGLENDIINRVGLLLQAESDLTIRQQAMELFCSLASHAIGRDALLKAQIVPQLVKLFDDPDDKLRLTVHETLVRLVTGFTVSHVPGYRTYIMSRSSAANKPETPLSANEPQDQAQEQQTIPAPAGVRAITDHNLVPLLFSKLPKERFDIQIRILKTLHECLRVGVVPHTERQELKPLEPIESRPVTSSLSETPRPMTVSSDAPLPILPRAAHPTASSQATRVALNPAIMQQPAQQTLLSLIEPTLPHTVKQYACKCLAALWMSGGAEAREGGVRRNAPAKLMALISDDLSQNGANTPTHPWYVKAAAAEALMSLTIDIEGKKAVVRENGVAVLTELLNRVAERRNNANPSKEAFEEAQQVETLKLNVIKTITNVAEEYRARFSFQPAVAHLKLIASNSENMTIVEAANIAISVINWRP